ncbi:hypothetical protein NMG60_11007293 [Bertholletia excelsa]
MEGYRPASGNYELDCQFLYSCFTGNAAASKQKLVELLVRHDSQALKLIRQTFFALYNQELLVVLSRNRHNDALANVIYLRISEPADRDAEILRDAMFGWRVNLNILIEVVITRSSSELLSIKEAYRFRYNSEIEQDIAHKTSGSYKELLNYIIYLYKTCTYFRSCTFKWQVGGRVDMSMAMCDAKTLYEAVESGNSVDWKTIMSLISERNTAQMRAILVAYKQLYGYEFSKFLKGNKCGKLGREFRQVVRGIQFPHKFFVKQLRGALHNGADGAREVLIRVTITRLEVDIRDISNGFAAKTGWSLGNFVRREFSDGGGDKSSGLVGQFLLGLLQHC